MERGSRGWDVDKCNAPRGKTVGNSTSPSVPRPRGSRIPRAAAVEEGHVPSRISIRNMAIDVDVGCSRKVNHESSIGMSVSIGVRGVPSRFGSTTAASGSSFHPHHPLRHPDSRPRVAHHPHRARTGDETVRRQTAALRAEQRSRETCGGDTRAHVAADKAESSEGRRCSSRRRTNAPRRNATAGD